MEIGHSILTTRRMFRDLSWLSNPFPDSPDFPELKMPNVNIDAIMQFE